MQNSPPSPQITLSQDAETLTLFSFVLNRNKKETLSQNYRRLGLVARLKGPTGGTELSLSEATRLREARTSTSSSLVPSAASQPPRQPKTPLAIQSIEGAVISEVKVERDATGRIIRVIRSSAKKNPLNDPLNEFDDDSEEEEEEGDEWGGIEDTEEEKREMKKTQVVRELEELAAQPVVKKPRHQSEREREWIERLVERYGEENTGAMARDRRLNPMQQTEADIRRRIRIWKEGRD